MNNEFEEKLMGGAFRVAIYDVPSPLAKEIFLDAYKEGKRLEKIFNFFDKESELSKLNKKRKLLASPELFEVLSRALWYAKETNGAYDVTIGKQILARKKGEVEPKVKCSYKDVKLGEGTYKEVKVNDGKYKKVSSGVGAVAGQKREVELIHEDVLIDLGSIAKGYVADKVGEFLKEKGVESFFIDARGDMLSFGEHEELVEVQHPREEKGIHEFVLKNSAVATSGDYKQYYGTYKKSHIVNQKELISVTVVASTLLEADAFASAVFLLAPKERGEFIRKHTQYKVLTIDENLIEKEYNGFFELERK